MNKHYYRMPTPIPAEQSGMAPGTSIRPGSSGLRERPGPSFTDRNAWLKKPSPVKPNNGPAGRNDQEYAPGNSLEVATETDNETRDKIYHARGIRLVHVLQVDDYRNFLATVLADGGGIPKASEAHYYGFDTVTHGKLANRRFIVVLNLTDVLGSICVLID
jgi:hypothetical protein